MGTGVDVGPPPGESVGDGPGVGVGERVLSSHKLCSTSPESTSHFLIVLGDEIGAIALIKATVLVTIDVEKEVPPKTP